MLSQNIPCTIQPAEAEGGIRCRVKITAGIVQTSVVPLPSFDEAQPSFNGFKELFILIIFAFLTEIQTYRIRQQVNGKLSLHNFARHPSVVRTGGVSHLLCQIVLHSFFRRSYNMRPVSFHDILQSAAPAAFVINPRRPVKARNPLLSQI